MMSSIRAVLTPRAAAIALLLFATPPALAEVTSVTIRSRSPVANGRVFGEVGTYEQLSGRIEFAIDPADPHNQVISDLGLASRSADGRVHFSSDLFVLRPTDSGKGNGVLLFEIANRGNRVLPAMFNRGEGDAATEAGIGDGWLMREGYTIVWIGWEFDLPATALRLVAPVANLPPNQPVEPLGVDIVVNERVTETFMIDEPLRPPVPYRPADATDERNTLTVRDRFWDAGSVIPRDRWRFVLSDDAPPKIHLEGGFEPGRWYRVTYRAASPVVAGVGLAAIREAASAFRYRTDLPIQGLAAYAYGNSQTGRFLRQFIYDGFNADENGRRVFEAIWVHIAGAARGTYNQRFATPSHGDMFRPTQFPFADAEEVDVDGRRDGLQARYRPDQRPKIFYSNTPVEYWGGGRAAALIHTSVDGTRDLTLPDNLRIYLLASTQHLPFPFPPDRRRVPGANGRNDGEALSNPVPQNNTMRALLRALHRWAGAGVPPPSSAYPRLRDATLVPVAQLRFPKLTGISDPQQITGPARIRDGQVVPLPFLVPQVDADGNDIAGIHDPVIAVPLATATGWNFRHARVGNPGDIYQTLGAYIPFALTRMARETAFDSRRSVAERYRDLADYLRQIRSAADGLVVRRFLLQEDVDEVMARARAYWNFAQTPRAVQP